MKKKLSKKQAQAIYDNVLQVIEAENYLKATDIAKFLGIKYQSYYRWRSIGIQVYALRDLCILSNNKLTAWGMRPDLDILDTSKPIPNFHEYKLQELNNK